MGKKEKEQRVVFTTNTSSGQREGNSRFFRRSLDLNGHSSLFTGSLPNNVGTVLNNRLEKTTLPKRSNTVPPHLRPSRDISFSHSTSSPLSGSHNYYLQKAPWHSNNVVQRINPSGCSNLDKRTIRPIIKPRWPQVCEEGSQGWRTKNRRRPEVIRMRSFDLETIESIGEIGLRISIFLKKDNYRFLQKWNEIIESKFTSIDPKRVFFNELSSPSWIRFFSNESFTKSWDFLEATRLYDFSPGGISDLKNDEGKSFRLLEYKFRDFLEPALNKKKKGFHLDLSLKLGYQYLFSWKEALLTIIDIEDRSLKINDLRQKKGKRELSISKLEYQLAYYSDKNKYKTVHSYWEKEEEKERKAEGSSRTNKKTNREIVKKWCLLDDGLLNIEDFSGTDNIEINVNLFVEVLMESKFGAISDSKRENNKAFYNYWDIFVLETGILIDEEYRDSLKKSLVGVVEKKIAVLTYDLCSPYFTDNNRRGDSEKLREIIEHAINERLSSKAYPNYNSENNCPISWRQEALILFQNMETIQSFYELFQSIKLLCTLLEEPSFKTEITIFLQDHALDKIVQGRGIIGYNDWSLMTPSEIYNSWERARGLPVNASLFYPLSPKMHGSDHPSIINHHHHLHGCILVHANTALLTGNTSDNIGGINIQQLQQQSPEGGARPSDVYVTQEGLLRDILKDILPNIVLEKLREFHDETNHKMVDEQKNEIMRQLENLVFRQEQELNFLRKSAVPSIAFSPSSSNNAAELVGNPLKENVGSVVPKESPEERCRPIPLVYSGENREDGKLSSTTKVSTIAKTDDDIAIVSNRLTNNSDLKTKKNNINNDDKNDKKNTKQLVIIVTIATFSSSLLLLLIKKLLTMFFRIKIKKKGRKK